MGGALPRGTAPARGSQGHRRRPAQATSRGRLNGPLETERLFALLRADAGWLEHAADAEQRARIAGKDLSTLDTALADGKARASAPVWADTDEGKHAQRTEIDKLAQAYTKEWGHPPQSREALQDWLAQR